MTKQGLTLLIINAALQDCDNHVLRLSMINRLADKNCLPQRFITTNNQSFFLFTVGGCDFHYEDNGTKWFVKPAISQHATMQQQPLELLR